MRTFRWNVALALLLGLMGAASEGVHRAMLFGAAVLSGIGADVAKLADDGLKRHRDQYWARKFLWFFQGVHLRFDELRNLLTAHGRKIDNLTAANVAALSENQALRETLRPSFDRIVEWPTPVLKIAAHGFAGEARQLHADYVFQVRQRQHRLGVEFNIEIEAEMERDHFEAFRNDLWPRLRLVRDEMCRRLDIPVVRDINAPYYCYAIDEGWLHNPEYPRPELLVAAGILDALRGQLAA